MDDIDYGVTLLGIQFDIPEYSYDTIHTLTGTTLLITFEWQISENTRQVYRNRV